MPICANDAPPISTTITSANKSERIDAGMRIGFLLAIVLKISPACVYRGEDDGHAATAKPTRHLPESSSALYCIVPEHCGCPH
jgi:hypothetical protein